MLPDDKKKMFDGWYWPDMNDIVQPSITKRFNQILKWADENEQEWLLEFLDRRADHLKSLSSGEPRRKLPMADDLADRFDLTPAESEILEQFLSGRTLREIADAQKISINTVRTHFVHIRGKLDARDQADVVRIAMFSGVAGRAHRT